ncbi:branched-chain amino acid ABC transporter permease [Pinisolibacter aquiterrae]|uniref:branched-chain amino acid ABC transporter permease n=1 Tax=Pinisolibacter aquiterrae TaxID=2815579 RepID=UPI001C3D36EC|nr:branched-chain amino acid ABC transporter permease [Pinisolibacter aquiterrae]MCC8237069.1 branched-chain amino acid ABC transporter permease [Pinisolibacter aquiterrae]
MELFAEQLLNGVQFGVTLFLMASGLTLVFGIMNFINLAHGSLYMIGAFLGAAVQAATGSFLVGILVAVPATAAIGVALELGLFRRFYSRNHLDQVLVTFGIVLMANEATRLVFGPVPLRMPLPEMLSGSIELLPGLTYPTFRLVVLGVGLAVAGLLWLVVMKTRLGMWVRAGSSNRAIAGAMGVDVGMVFAGLFAFGAALAGLAGLMAGPILAVQVGMGEPILILALVVTVIGGIGSIRGAFVAALMVGLVDTFGRVMLPPALGSMAIFLLMAAILAFKPKGLFPVHG